MTTHSNYSLQNFSTNNAKVLTGNSQPVPDFMALCNQGIISQENISGIDNSNGNLFSREKILGIDNSNKNLPLENEENVNAKADEKVKAEAEAKEKNEDTKANAEAEVKPKEKEANDILYKENLNLLQYKLVYQNTNLSNFMFENRILNIKTFERFKKQEQTPQGFYYSTLMTRLIKPED